MSWHCLPELAVEYLGESFLDGTASVQSKSKNIHEVCLSGDNGMEFLVNFLSGMTSGHSMENHGEGKVDIVTGGFPCQDISIAGKGTGIEGERSGLWGEMARVIHEVQPRYALVENSPMLTSRGLGRVLGDLAEMGYNARWAVLGADDVGAPHKRKRIWILAYSNSKMHGCIHRENEINSTEKLHDAQCYPITISREYARKDVAYTSGLGRKKRTDGGGEISTKVGRSKLDIGSTSPGEWWSIDPAELPDSNRKRQQEFNVSFKSKESGFDTRVFDETGGGNRWPVESRLGRVANGVANRVDRLKSIGNGQVPEVVVAAWNILTCNGI